MSNLSRLILFDGECNLCDQSVQFVFARNPEKNLHFSSLQSEFSKTQRIKFDLSADNKNSIIFIDGSQTYTKSTAVIKIGRYLNFPWRLIGIFIYIPQSWRDVLYNWVARNRINWFGRSQHCLVGNSELQARILS